MKPIDAHWKTLAVPLLVLALLFGVGAFVLSSKVLVARLGEVERQNAAQAAQQLQAAMEYEAEHLRVLASSYSEWVDAFEFAQGRNAGYMDTNFAPEYLRNIDVDLVWALDLDGRLLASAASGEQDSEHVIPVPDDLTRQVLQALGDPVAARDLQPDHRYVQVDGALYSLAAKRISMDDLTGDAGTLVFARRWDETRMAALTRLVRRGVTLLQPPAGESPEHLVHEDSSGELHVHSWLMQPDGSPAVLLSLDWQREHMDAARRTTIMVILGLVAGFLALAVLLVMRLRRTEAELLKHQGRLVAMARTDVLTGLHNRSILDELQATEPGANRAAVLYIDVDRFKGLNDSLGHAVGDEILRAVASRLQAAVAGTDLVVRLGGDEFLIIARDVAEPEVLAQLARRICHGFTDPLKVTGSAVYVTLSVGAARCPHDSRTLEGAIRLADIALYQVKERGRNGFHLYDGDQTSITPRSACA